MSGPCPSCRGNPREEVDGEVYVCPDCAGTGNAENSITANEKLCDAAPRLAAALKEIAEWPNGGNRYGQQNIKEFARAALREAGVGDE